MMFFSADIETWVDCALFASCIFLVVGSLYISFKTRFVQLYMFPHLFKMLWRSVRRKEQGDQRTILPHRALFTAMSTTLGVTTIAGPAIAIHLGGPGALLGFLIISFLGSAATFMEVSLCVKFRNKLNAGFGPMEYLKKILSPKIAKWYAISCCILMTVWSGAQANQLAAIFDSPLLGEYRISPNLSGFIVAALVFFTLFGGIKRISALASKMVPLMFILFLGSSFWILLSNWELLPSTFATIFTSAFSPYAMASGTVVGGVLSTLRWGILKGTQTTEAGIGTQTIPHSMTECEDPVSQGTLSMISTYTAGFMAFLSGCVVLVTGTWQDPEIPVGIGMIAASFHMYFSTMGLAVVAICTFLFAFGTILGNSYNGSQCFTYLADSKKIRFYFALSACVIFAGAISDVKTIWSLVDVFLVGMALPHMFALMRYVRYQEAI